MNEIKIHPRALVEDGAQIGAGTKIWVNAQIRSGATVGKGCVLAKDTFVDSHVTIGDEVKVQNGVSIYNGVTLADGVFVGPNAVFTNDRVPRARNTDWEITSTVVREGASIGANATIVCGVTLGAHCMVGAGSVVTTDVPNHGLVVGNPARLIGYVCFCGNRLTPDFRCEVCQRTIEVAE